MSQRSSWVGCTLIVFQWQPQKRQKTNVLVCGLSINASALIDKKAPREWHPCWQTHAHTYKMSGSSVIRLFLISTCTHHHIFASMCVCVLHRGLDLVNVHLFHDASNLIACNSSPSIYSANRKNALRYVISRSDIQLHPTVKNMSVTAKTHTHRANSICCHKAFYIMDLHELWPFESDTENPSK